MTHGVWFCVCVDVCCMRADGDAKRLDVVTEMREISTDDGAER